MAGALSDLKVVEVGGMVSAPYCTKLLADMGADVVKVERPRVGDHARTRGPFPKDEAHPEKSGLFLYLNANKKGITLDIEQSEGMELLDKLVAGADVLVQNVAPPDMDRIGLTYDRMKRVNPDLVMTSITPFGLSGPKRNWRAEDLTIWCAGGVCVLNGGGPLHAELHPLKTFGSQSGYQAGIHGAVPTLAAVFARLNGEAGQHVEVSAQEAIVSQLEMTFEYWPYMKMIATRLGQKPLQPIETMECKDGFIYLCCVEEHQWRNFVAIMGNPEWADEEIFGDRLKRAENWDVLKVLLEEWVSQQTVLDLYRKAQARRVPFAPVSTMGICLATSTQGARLFSRKLRRPPRVRTNIPARPHTIARRESVCPRRPRAA